MDTSDAAVVGAQDVLAGFAAQVAAQRSAVALDGGPSRRMTYGELYGASEALGRRILKAGVTPGQIVGLLFDSGLDFTIAALAALRAGAAFLPLDRRQPAERLAAVLAEAAVEVVICDPGNEASVPDGPRILRNGDGDTEPDAAEVSLPEPDGAALAYVFYTSGSTGRPKGVAVGRAELAAFARAFADRLPLRADDVVLQIAALGFDVVIEEIFPALIAGATIAFAHENGPLAPHELTSLMEQRGVTSVELTTTYWHEWVRQLHEEGRRPPAALRRVLVGSDRLDRGLVGRWLHWGVPLIHVYGTTETVVTNTMHVVSGEAVSDPDRPVPVGTSLAHSSVHILGDDLRPLEFGETGEIAVSGALARGYLGAPQLTRDRFVEIRTGPDEPGTRVYCTGDRGRLLPGGVLEFLGREDAQIKIHGFRLELGEVEAVLERLPWVERAVVVKAAGAEVSRLLGYVRRVGAPNPRALTAQENGQLADHCRGALPPHAVPAEFFACETFPVTVNGKVDRVLLAETDADRATMSVSAPLPDGPLLDPVCADVVRAWQDVLGRTGLDPDQGFIAQGGSSLAAMRVIAGLRARFGVAVPLTRLLRARSAGELARFIETEQAAGTGGPSKELTEHRV
ncbi:non-ribosomal peptide synthetase [Streptomyces sp. NBC_00503]|uniref:non-ribosomal peptide synthetase n=1 Tax=Streptomyces sp. NBC_00503 TaxID=2903659 RepID=UPI002E818A68|nr:non-ribosomal peptide synthetase [Streptomyces sp. NBC_00503]WUD84120.1 non-ribosomal peptide synthetase [Streptomyces sp. NBC_00503]